jgi:hypothetical protein
MSTMAIDSNAKPIQVLRPTATEKNAVSGTAVAATAVSEGTRVVRIVSTVDVHYSLLGTATANSTFLPANAIEYVHVFTGDVFSLITSGGTGNVHLTAMV